MAIAVTATSNVTAQVPFTLQAPGLNPDHYRQTTFANALGFPVGMAELPDGSLLVAESFDGGYLQSKRGTLTRLADTNSDGIADVRTELVTDVPFGLLTTVRVVDDYVFLTGQNRPLQVYKLGASPPTHCNRSAV